MQVIESFIMGKKGDPDRCEDALVVTDEFVSVVDGVTSKSAMLWKERTTGRLAAEAITQAIAQFPPDITAAAAAERLTEEICLLYEECRMADIAREHPAQRFAACAAIYSRFRSEIWVIGDCQCMIDQKHFEFPKRVDEIIAEARALYIESELYRGKTVKELLDNDTSRQYILPLIERGASFANDRQGSKYAYPVIDGFPIDIDQIRIIPVPAGTQEIVLASDGYPRLFPTLTESEHYLSRILETDPLCYREYKSTKGVMKDQVSFDDRTYIRISCGP